VLFVCSAARLFGLANGLYVLLLGTGVATVTFALLIVEGVLGWHFFSVFELPLHGGQSSRTYARADQNPVQCSHHDGEQNCSR